MHGRDESFRDLLLRHRGRSGLTQRELASRLGVHTRSVQDWEGGVNFPSAERLEILITGLLEVGALSPGAELEEAQALWAAVERDSTRMRTPFDRTWFERLVPKPTRSIQAPTDAAQPQTGERRQDWGEAPDVHGFVGRREGLRTLREWVLDKRSRLVAVVGMGGIGKTSLVAKLAQDVAPSFERVYWRSVRDAPPTTDWLARAIGFVSDQQPVPRAGVSELITDLIRLLRDRRCLLVLDNFDTLFEPGQGEGRYRSGLEGYGLLLRGVAEATHQSCLVLTSREAPTELAVLGGDMVRTFHVGGFGVDDARVLLAAKQLVGSEALWSRLNDRFGGNGLALKVVGESIRELFDGHIDAFLDHAGEDLVFGGIRRLLSEQVERSSATEQQVLRVLAVEREPTRLAELLAGLGPRVGRAAVVEAVEALRRRSLVERTEVQASTAVHSSAGFTLQSVVLEYVTDRLVEAVAEEVRRHVPELLIDLPLIKAHAKDYVRQSQERLICLPVLLALSASVGDAGRETALIELLEGCRGREEWEQGYAPGNVVNLLRLQRCGDLRGLDLSRLAIRQAYLADVEAQDASLVGAHLGDSVLAEAFDFPASIALSADGAYLAAGTSTGQFWVWRVADRTLVAMCDGHSSAIWGLALAADGSVLATGGGDGTVGLWESRTGASIASWQAHTGAAWSLALAPDAQFLVSGGDDGTVSVWDLPSGRSLARMRGHKGAVRTVALTAEAGLVASGGQDGIVRLWDLRSTQLIAELPGHTGGLWGVALSEDGKLLASGGQDGTVRVWDASTRHQLTIFEGQTGGVWSVALSGDGSLLASGDGDGNVRLWELPSGRAQATLRGHAGAVWGARFTRDGRLVATGGGDGSVRLWESGTAHSWVTLQGHTSAVRGVALSADGALAASGGQDGIVRLWDTSSGKLRGALQGHTGGLWGVALSRDGRVVASSSGDGTVRIWGSSTGRLVSTLRGHSGGVWCVGLSADGQVVASGGQDGTVRLWESNTARPLLTVRAHTSAVAGLAISADGSLVASGGAGGLVRVCDASGQLLARLEGHTSAVWGMTLSADGHLLASGSEDGTVRLWELPGGRALATLQAHTSGVYSLALTADGRLLASAGADGEVRLWDVRSRQCLTTMRGHSGIVRGVALSADGHLVASAGLDATVRLWNATTHTPIHVLRSARRYERVDISGLTGVTAAQRMALLALGAVERSTPLRQR